MTDKNDLRNEALKGYLAGRDRRQEIIRENSQFPNGYAWELAEESMIVFDCMLNASEGSNFGVYVQDLRDEGGQMRLREVAFDIGKQLYESYQAVRDLGLFPEGQNNPWDFEIVPWILERMCTKMESNHSGSQCSADDVGPLELLMIVVNALTLDKFNLLDGENPREDI